MIPKSARRRCAPVNLTDLKVRSLKPDPAGEYLQPDTQVPGLSVRVRPNGSLTYQFIKRLPGARKTLRVTVGRAGEIGVAEARESARRDMAAVRQGVDISAVKRRDRERQTRQLERASRIEAATGFSHDSFGALAEAYIRVECGALARGAEVASIIRRSLLPAWGDRPLDALRRRDLTGLLDPIVASGRTQTAHKLREVAIRIINWAIDRGDLEVNFLASPSRGRRRAGVLRRTRRDRVLTQVEIRAIWNACDFVGQPFGNLIRLALILGQRRDEIAGMTRAELDLEQNLWVIPGSRYKTKLDHIVPLPPLAVELLRRMPKTDAVYVFSTRPGTKFSGFTRAMNRLRRISGVADWRIHDLRRTVRTGLSGLKVDADVAERVIGHVITGVRGIYDRYGYLDEKRDALDRWARRLGDIDNPLPPEGNVVGLRVAS